MIGWLRGDVVSTATDGTVVLNVRDVGYELTVAARTLRLLVEGGSVDLHVHTHVREDAIILYGFLSLDERATFELLLSSKGVGPSTALGALSVMTPNELSAAIAAEDVTLLTTIPGIGRKTASQLILDLNGKLVLSEDRPAATTGRADVASDLTSALRQLGYSSSEIREGLRDLDLPDDDEAALRMALRQLGRV